MCATCGCDSDDAVRFLLPGETAHHSHDHTNHGHHHSHDHPAQDGHHHHVHHDHSHATKKVTVERDILLKNDLMAERNRGFFDAKNIQAINLVSSPGSGKTTLLESTILRLGDTIPLAVIEGDQQTTQDADRIHAAGARAIQVNTGKGCHLDADMIRQAIRKLSLENDSLLFIENVGNLVCPSMFDLGEQKRVVIISVTEGEDKPLKYPDMFATSDICIINKTDLLPYVSFDVDKFKEYALRVNHHLTFFEVSATKQEGMDEWCEWLKQPAEFAF